MNYCGMLSSLCALSLISVATNVAALEELGKVELEPMSKPPQLKVGQEWHWYRNGEEVVNTVTAIDGDSFSAKNSRGCSWTEVVNHFGPSLAWASCSPFSDGTQIIAKIKGSPWPMKAKSKFKYSFKGSNSKGETWKAQRSAHLKRGNFQVCKTYSLSLLYARLTLAAELLRI
ncbi:MAG: hypothetical protein ACR2RB_23090 [Gammaproteobacteria bacterium]